jgi:Sec-independent protein translocase protein TatA
MEPALKIVEPEEVGQKGLTYAEQVTALPPIKTAEEYLQVDQIWKNGKAILVEISEGYDDLIKAAHKLHKDAIAKKDKYYKPAEAAVKAAKRLMSDYDEEQERIRKAEEDRLRKEAEKKEEEERLALALEAEQNGQHEEAEAIIETPVVVAPIILPKATPKPSGGAVFQTRWFASVTDIKALCRAVGNGQASTEYVMGLSKDKITGIISSPALNSRATSDKNTLNIPGVQALSKRV